MCRCRSSEGRWSCRTPAIQFAKSASCDGGLLAASKRPRCAMSSGPRWSWWPSRQTMTPLTPCHGGPAVNLPHRVCFNVGRSQSTRRESGCETTLRGSRWLLRALPSGIGYGPASASERPLTGLPTQSSAQRCGSGVRTFQVDPSGPDVASKAVPQSCRSTPERRGAAMRARPASNRRAPPSPKAGTTWLRVVMWTWCVTITCTPGPRHAPNTTPRSRISAPIERACSLPAWSGLHWVRPSSSLKLAGPQTQQGEASGQHGGANDRGCGYGSAVEGVIGVTRPTVDGRRSTGRSGCRR